MKQAELERAVLTLLSRGLVRLIEITHPDANERVRKRIAFITKSSCEASAADFNQAIWSLGVEFRPKPG